MRCCDQSTLIALARCSRFALAAASSPFVWQPLPPIALRCVSPLELGGRLQPSLLRHADISVTWLLRSAGAVSAELESALALPRLRGLSIESLFDPVEVTWVPLSDEGAALLLEALSARIDRGGALTTLSLDCRGLRQAGGAALATYIERSRTLTTLKVTDLCAPLTASEMLVPLAAALIRCRTLTCLELQSAESDPAAVRTLATVVQQSSSLTAFKLQGLRCDADSAAVLAAAIAQSRSLTDLQLRSYRAGDAVLGALAAALERSGCIRTLDLSYSDFGAAGAAALARLLASDRCTITSLDVAENKIQREGALALAEGLQANRSLTELNLGQNEMGEEGTAAVVSALRHNPHICLRVLILAEGNINQRAAAALGETVQRSAALERLDVRNCSLTDETMATLAAGLGHCHSLNHLDVSGNKFGAAGAAALGAAITTCPALTSLNVDCNSIGHAGLAALAPALAPLRSLDLRVCGLTRHSATSLAALIRDSRALETLDVGFNEFGADGVTELAAALQPSSSLRSLDLRAESGWAVGARATAALADALRRGWRASELLLLWDRTIGDRGAVALAAALEQLGARCPLASLSVVDCGLTAAGALALVRAATVTPALRSLDLDFNSGITAADRPALIAACGPQPHFELRLWASSPQ
jgi:Ran GTPase-activating protein (RanGAP) involved in mRNA processing and transport